MRKFALLLIFIYLIAFTLHNFVLADNPASPFTPSQNIQDPGDPATPGTGGTGCGPTDSNCYVTVDAATRALSNLASVAINTSLVSDTDNTDALGSSLIGWADLFLGSGAVINFAAGDVTLTHSANTLTFGGGDLDASTNIITNIGATGTDFLAGGGLTLDDILTVNDDLTVALTGSENIEITDGATSTDDIVSIIANGASVTADANALEIDFTTGNGSNVTQSGLQIDLASGGTVPGDIIYGINLTMDAADASTQTAINIGTNFDTGIVSASSYVQSAGTMSLTSANTNQTTTSSIFALNGNSLTSGTGFYAASSSLSSGSLVNLVVSGVAAASNTQKVLNVSTSGANGNSGQNTYGGYFSNTHTGTSSINYGLYGSASGAESGNYGIHGESSATDGGGVSAVASGGGSVSGSAALIAANSGTSGTGYGVNSTVFGAKTTGIAGYFAATEATNNYAIIVPSSSGSVGIGDTTPDYLLDIESNVASSVANFFNDGNATTRAGIIVQSGLDDHTAAGPSTLVTFNDGDGGTVGSITFGSSLTAYNTTSDRRLKDNITNTSLSINNLMDIQIRDFTWKADRDNKVSHGFIAQELYDVYPSAVTVPTDSNGYYMVDYSKLMPLAIKSIQDLNLKLIGIENFESENQQNNSFGEKLRAWFGNIENGVENLYAKVIHSDKVETKELCLEDVCVTKAQLIELLQNSNQIENNQSSQGGEIEEIVDDNGAEESVEEEITEETVPGAQVVGETVEETAEAEPTPEEEEPVPEPTPESPVI